MGKDTLVPAAKVRLTESIQYNTDSIVSRTLIDRSSCTITLFAFDQGHGLSEHTAPFDALVQILQGEAEITIGGKPAAVSEGELIWMPASVPHSLRSVTAFKMLLTMIRA